MQNADTAIRFIFPKCGWSGVFKNPSGPSCFHELFVRIDILIILYLIRGYQLWLIKKVNTLILCIFQFFPSYGGNP